MGRSAPKRRSSGSRADPRSMEFLSSHPATPERVANATLNARQYAAPGAGAKEREDYLRQLDGMVYGEDPSEGFVRGRRFLHPKLGFTFQVPEGFVLENTAQAVVGVAIDPVVHIGAEGEPPRRALAALLHLHCEERRVVDADADLLHWRHQEIFVALALEDGRE